MARQFSSVLTPPSLLASPMLSTSPCAQSGRYDSTMLSLLIGVVPTIRPSTARARASSIPSGRSRSGFRLERADDPSFRGPGWTALDSPRDDVLVCEACRASLTPLAHRPTATNPADTTTPAAILSLEKSM